jgi:hypothetical protein
MNSKTMGTKILVSIPNVRAFMGNIESIVDSYLDKQCVYIMFLLFIRKSKPSLLISH